MKLPLSKAITTTFAYLTEEFLTWLKILWLPVLLLQTAMIAIMPKYMTLSLDIMELGDDADPSVIFSMLGPIFLWMGILALLSVVIYAIGYSGVFRHISRGEVPSTPFYLQFGADEGRVILTMVLGVLLLMVVYLGGALALTATTAVLTTVAGAVGGIIAFFLMIGFLVGVVWFYLRLSLILPAAVAEKSIGIAPSWATTKGNTWALFAYWLLWFIVIMFFASAYSIVAMPDYFSLLGEMIAAGENEAEVDRINIEMTKQSMAMYDISNPRFALLALATYIYSLAIFAVTTVASGVAYWFLTDKRAVTE